MVLAVSACVLLVVAVGVRMATLQQQSPCLSGGFAGTFSSSRSAGASTVSRCAHAASKT